MLGEHLGTSQELGVLQTFSKKQSLAWRARNIYGAKKEHHPNFIQEGVVAQGMKEMLHGVESGEGGNDSARN